MKKIFTLLTVISLSLSVFAQAPQKMSYQCVVRNASGVLITNQNVGIRISILHSTPSGTVVYQETYSPNPQTNANGLATIEIGGGVPVTGTFSAINWASGPYYLKTETDPTGGTSYTVIGTSQLLSVPYALDAKTAENYSESDPVYSAWNKSAGISITSSQVSDFTTSVTNNAAVLANTAKVTNATHTGDVTGSGALTIANKVTMTGTAPIVVTGSPTVIAANPVAVSIAAATHSVAGSMSAADKTKLDGISSSGITSYSIHGGGNVTFASTTVVANTRTQVLQLTGIPAGTYGVYFSCPIRNLSTSINGLNVAWAVTANDADPTFPEDAVASAFIPASGWVLNYPFGQSGYKEIILAATGTIELKITFWGVISTSSASTTGTPTLRAVKLN
jgi:hypothetical protein